MMAQARVVFTGWTQDEIFALQVALEHSCNCEFDPKDHHRISTCAPHRMFAEDQKAIDHLVFVRRQLAQRVVQEEFETK